MPYVTADDGVRLYCEETGSGSSIVFVHEFAGDHRSWQPQIRHFARFHRCVAFAARGYAPSDIPESLDMYSQARAVDDIAAVMAGLGIVQAHVVGLSMGAYATLHLGLRRPPLVRSMVIAACGWGSEPDKRAANLRNSETIASLFETAGSAVAGERYANVPARWPLLRKDPRGWAEFLEQLKGHSALGSARTLRGVQMRRPSLWDFAEDLKRIKLPTLIVAGDEDEQCLQPGLLMKRNIPDSGLLVLPRTGHAINLEEPDAFNAALAQFFHAVEAGRWPLTGGQA
ncbi:MAG: alpha/beta fold hydrolase [Alphaproteobacteria bacterium]|nr:alpha/beta fold hydrolase [Alphaproteobacteria bacterium]